MLSDPVPVTALLGSVTPEAWCTMIDAEALIPALTWELLSSRSRTAL